jgi:hypothetical protein
MISQFASFRQQISDSDWNVVAESGGSLTGNESVEFFIQAHNRVGVNLLSTGKVVAISPNQKVRVTINAGAIKSGEDIFKFVISARRGVATPVQIAEIYVKEPNQVTYKALPISLSFTQNAHIATTLIGSLTTDSNRINGQIRIISGIAYRYDEDATRGYEESDPGYWVEDSRAGFVNIVATKNNYGCDRSTATASPTIPITISTQGSLQTEPLVYWWANNLASNLGNFTTGGTGLNLRIYLDGQLNNAEGVPYSNLFNNLISLRFLGYVDLVTGILDTTLSDVNVFKRWSPSNSGMVLPVDLLPGYAAAYSLQLEFTTTSLATLVSTGGGLSIEIVKQPSGGVYSPGGSVLGDSVTSGLQVIPNSMLSGSATLGNYQVDFRSPSFFIGLVADTANQKIVIDATPDGLVKAKTTNLIEGEYLRAVVSTLPGTQRMSQWSEIVAVNSNAKTITLTYPVNEDTSLATIRGDYPDLIAGLTGAMFNVPQVIIYVDKMTYNSGLGSYSHQYYKLPNQSLIADQATQEFTLSDFTNATEVTENALPTTNDQAFGVFGYFAPILSDSSVSGTLSGTHLRVAIAYHYPANNTALTKISHDPTLGCLPQLRGSLISSLENSLYWLSPVTTISLARGIAKEKLIHGAIVFVISEGLFYWFDSYSSQSDDGAQCLKPTAIEGIGRLLGIVSSGSGLDSVDWGAKGELITSDGTNQVLLARGANGRFLKSDDASPSGLSWDTLTGGGSNLVISTPHGTTAGQVITNTNATNTVSAKPMWSTSQVAASPSPKCLVYTHQYPLGNNTVANTFFIPISTPSAAGLKTLVYDSIDDDYSWTKFTLSGLLDTFDEGTPIPHNSQLIYDAGTDTWNPGIGRVETTLSNLLDTYIDTPTPGYPLIWDGGVTNKFIIGVPDLSFIEGLNYDIAPVTIPGDLYWNFTKVLVSARNPGRDLRGTFDSVAVINTTLSTLSPYPGGSSSFRFAKTSRQSIQIGTNANTTLGSNIFCLEMFFRPTQLSSGLSYALAGRSDENEADFVLILSETTPGVFNVLFYGTTSNGTIVVGLQSNLVSGLQLNTWYHVAVSRNGNDWRLFVDGNVQDLKTASQALITTFANPSQIFLTLGRINGLASNDDTQYVGEIEDFRLTIGNPRYISNFTRPSGSLAIQSGGTRDEKSYYINFAGLIDVDETVTPLENYVPAWSTAQSKYVPKPIGSGGEVVSLSLNQITGVNVSASTTNNFLAKDADGIWRGRAIGTGVTSVNGLSGVVTLTSDQITQGTTNLYLTPGAIATGVAAVNLEGLANVQDTVNNDLYLRKVSGVWQGVTITFPVTGVNSKTGNITLTTTDIAEGTRLYYTDTRVTTLLGSTSINAFNNVTLTSPANNQSLVYSGGAFVNQTLSTSIINEGTNLYYTDTRVSTRVNTLGISSFGGLFTGSGTTGQIVSLAADGKLTFINAPSGGSGGGLTNADIDARVNTLGISSFGGLFTGSGTNGQIVSLNASGKLTFINAPSGGSGGGLTNEDVDARVNTLGISSFGGLFTGTPVEGNIPVVNAAGKLAMGNPVPWQQFRAVTGNHLLVASDHGKIVQITNASTVTLSTGLPTGFQVTIFNETNTTITLSSVGTIKAKSLTCSRQYGAIYLSHLGSNIWIAVGDLG